MTTMTTAGRVPEFTLGWRMRLALDSADMSVQEMAEHLGYSRSSVSRWLNDLDEPRAAVTAQWALLTGVDRSWLEQGTPGSPDPGPGLQQAAALRKLTEAKRTRSIGGAAPNGDNRRYLVSAA